MDDNKPASELYEASRSQVNHYQLSIGLRLIWLNNSQAFMFGIYVGTVVVRASTPYFMAAEHNLYIAIPIIGFLIALFILSDIITSLVQIHKLGDNYKNSPEDKQFFPLVYTGVFNRLLQHVSPVLSSLLFIVIWGGLILNDHHLIG